MNGFRILSLDSIANRSINCWCNGSPVPDLTQKTIPTPCTFLHLKESRTDAQFHLAALRGDVERLRKILDTGKVHVDSRDRDGTTPLILAAAAGHIDCVKELLEQGADPAARRITGTTALFFAAQGGYLDVAQVLLANGARIDSASVDGGTPLFVACQCGHYDIVREFIKHGSNVNSSMKDKATPLFIASQNGHIEIVDLLLQNGARCNAVRTDGASSLWIAAQMGYDHIVKLLLRHGAKVDQVRNDGATALFKAAHKGHSAVVSELLKCRPNLGILPNGESALHGAALFGQLGCVKLLIAANSDVMLRNQSGLTPYQLAMSNNKKHVASYLHTLDMVESVRESPV